MEQEAARRCSRAPEKSGLRVLEPEEVAAQQASLAQKWQAREKLAQRALRQPEERAEEVERLWVEEERREQRRAAQRAWLQERARRERGVREGNACPRNRWQAR